MKDVFISLSAGPPDGFECKTPTKRDLLGGRIALFVDSLDAPFSLLDNFTGRVCGAVITTGGSFSHSRIGPDLWHLNVTGQMLPHTREMASCFLELVSHGQKAKDENRSLLIELARNRKNRKQIRQSYDRSAHHLGAKIEDLRSEMEIRKRAEKALRETEKRFRELAEMLPEGVFETNSDLRVSYINRRAMELTGHSSEDFSRGVNALDLLVPEDRDRAWDNVIRRQSGEVLGAIEYQLLKKDGSTCPVLFHSDTIMEEGRFCGFRGVIVDISEQKRAENSLRESEAILVEAQRIAHIGNWTWDLSSNRIQWSDEMFSIYGIERGTSPSNEEMRKRIIHDDRSVMDNALQGTERGEVLDRIEYRIVGPDEKIRYIVVRAEAVRDDSGVLSGLIGTAQDITDRREAEEERERLIEKLEVQNAELERFTYTVSHDLKSPLITIVGYIGFIRRNLESGDLNLIDQDLSNISDAATRMDQLLRDLLELSRVGRLINPAEVVPIEELTREALKIVVGRTRESGVIVKISPDLPVVYGDRIRLLEVMQNLLDNAVKYMGAQPRPLVEIGSRLDGDRTVLYVRDNGIGVESRFHEKIFGLFDQLDPSMEGSGIGLSLVKRIVEVHGGRIWVESKGRGEGSTFCFTIPENSGQTKEHAS